LPGPIGKIQSSLFKDLDKKYGLVRSPADPTVSTDLNPVHSHVEAVLIGPHVSRQQVAIVSLSIRRDDGVRLPPLKTWLCPHLQNLLVLLQEFVLMLVSPSENIVIDYHTLDSSYIHETGIDWDPWIPSGIPS